MCSKKIFKVGLPLLGCISLLATSPLLVQEANAACGTGLGGTIGLSDTNGNTIDSSSFVHIGDVIVVSLLEVQNQDSSYRATGIVASVIFPSGTSQNTMSIPNLRPGSSCDSINGGLQGLHCPGGTAVGTLPPGATCLPFVNTYTVTFADVTNSSALSCIGTHPPAKMILFKQIAVGTALTSAGTVAGSATACEDIAVPVIFPCISVTKSCVVNCPPTNSAAYGSPIAFTGQVCNTGDTPLSNVQVIDTPAGGSPVVITNIASLAAGQCVSYSGSYTPSGNLCGPFTDTVTATGQDLSGRTITNTSACINPATGASTGPRPPVTATCTVCTSPCLAITKDCSPKNATAASPTTPVTINFSGIVTNCGNVPLTNVVVTDSVDGGGSVTVTNIALLPVGHSSPYSGTYQVTGCTTHFDHVHATAANLCGGAVNSNDAFCTNVVTCPPCINVTKEVACFLGTNGAGADVCGTFSKFATGVQATHADGSIQEPAFCFRITVTNCTSIDLTNVSVIDDKYGNLTADFPCISPVFHANTACTFEFKVAIGTTDTTITVVTNTVIASGQSATSGQTVSATNTAAAQVIPASVACAKFYTIDGGPFTNNVTISDSAAHTIVFYVTITNTGIANLLNLQVTDVGTIPACNSTFMIRELARGASTTVAVCTNASFSCSTNRGASDTITVVANSFSYTTNELPVCAFDIHGSNIVASTECTATIICTQPASCRVTGGGRQDVPTVCPSDVRYVTHGGQVGAPVGNMVCSIDPNLPNFFLGNPCIHGRWTHVRHMQGGGEGNFHARFFDTLDCACLDTNLNPATCQYGPGTVVHGICNPGDRLAGPEPRPAPANKIAFTGVGDWTCEKGGREPRACLFRVDIEDRGEPGNDHVLDLGHKPGRIPDQYRIRIWVLTDAEKAQLNSGSGADPYLIHFRDCISACNGINYKDGGLCGTNHCSGDTCTGAGSVGTVTFPGGCPVRTPNIDDGGELLHGNHQIHPSIMACDPANPTGPGLAKP